MRQAAGAWISGRPRDRTSGSGPVIRSAFRCRGLWSGVLIATFPFPGSKRAVRLAAQALPDDDQQARCDLAASFQAAVVASLVDRTRWAIALFQGMNPGALHLVGGRAASRRNGAIRLALDALGGAAWDDPDRAAARSLYR